MMMGLPPRHPPARAGQDRPHHQRRPHPAAHRQARLLQGEHRHRQGHRPVRIPGAAVEPGRRRPLSADLRRRRHQGPDHRCDERRHLPRHGVGEGPHPDPDVAGAAHRPPRHRLAERRLFGNADCRCDRLGAVARLHRRLADPQGRLRIRRDGRDPRRAGRSRQMRDGRSLCAGHRRNRDRRLSADRSRQLGHGRSVRRVHRLCGRRQEPEADHPRHRHHQPATIRSCAAPSKARCPARSRRTASARRSCGRRPPGTCSTAPAFPASPTSGARRCRPASTS